MTYGGFGEFALLPAKHLLRVPVCSAASVALLTSGLTASLGLEQASLSNPQKTSQQP
jgi:NADPH:quinone reductase-like Zn-dependent oxidoreductase